MGNKTYNRTLKPYAQKLRREMTREEQHLWYQFLNQLPCRAKRQQIIRTFIVDFYIPSAGIIIEIDGSQHYEQDAQIRDQERDAALERLGLLVLRYSNSDINQRFRDVCMDILLHVEKRKNFRQITGI